MCVCGGKVGIVKILGNKMLKRTDELEGLLYKRPAQDELLERNSRRVWKMLSDGDNVFRRRWKGLIYGLKPLTILRKA
jgi:hypothetical protein